MQNSIPKTTRPVSPRLQTHLRNRLVEDYKPAEEREREEIAAVKAAIKARRERSKALLERVRRRESVAAPLVRLRRTVPMSPKLATAQRAMLHEISDKQNARQESANRATAKGERMDGWSTARGTENVEVPMSRTVPKSPKLATAVRARSRLSVLPQEPSSMLSRQSENTPPLTRTIPVSPHLSYRHARKSVLPSEPEKPRKFKARPMPDFSRPPLKTKPTRTPPLTVPDPFQLSKSNKCTPTSPASPRKVFRARPMPDFGEINRRAAKRGDWSASRRKSTIPEPFELQSAKLHDAAVKRMAEEEEKRKQLEEEQRQFKARPIDQDMLERPLFVPTLKHKGSVPMNIEMHSTTRAKQRAAFDEEIRKKEEIDAARKIEIEKERMAAEEARLKEERKATVFKARLLPLSHFHPDLPAARRRPTTSPHTPALRTKERANELRDRYSYVYENGKSKDEVLADG